MMKNTKVAVRLVSGLILAAASPAAADERTDTAAAQPDGAPQADSQAAARERRTGGHSKAAFLKTHDVNGDGRVSLGEFVMKREADFIRTDADGNGALTKAEYVGEFTARMDAAGLRFAVDNRDRQISAANVRFGFMDSDENGIMTAMEFHDSGQRIFRRLDTNEDGFVDQNDTADSF